jgi:hypothetical protein
MISTTYGPQLIQKIRLLILLFIIGLIISGLTALPLESELKVMHTVIKKSGVDNSLTKWIEHIYLGLHKTNSEFPYISYGTDWLAFVHLIIAIVFIGPLRDPINNIWVIEFGLIACLCIFPFAFVAGAVRGIPLYWQLIDCSFGFIGGLILWRCYRLIKTLTLIQGHPIN